MIKGKFYTLEAIATIKQSKQKTKKNVSEINVQRKCPWQEEILQVTCEPTLRQLKNRMVHVSNQHHRLLVM